MPFPLRPMAWAVALDDVAEPADIWHGMWATSLPALQRLRSHHGGKTVYDCRDILLRSRGYEHMPRAMTRFLGRLEGRWARSADTVISVNDSYAELAARAFHVPVPRVVMNCPERTYPAADRPDRIREKLRLGPEVAIVLYQGALKADRGIEQSMDAILRVPGAVLVLLGFGKEQVRFGKLSQTDRYRGHVHVLEAVPAQELLTWSASADVLVMAIQPSSLNHRYTTPQKLFEAMAVGVPVVASDLPGMAAIVRATGSGELCDPESPASIAAALRCILEAPPETRAAYGRRALEAAHTQYNWETQLVVLGDVYARLLS